VEFHYVKLVADGEPQDQMIGKYQPQRLLASSPNTATVIANSRDRTHGSDFKFLVDLKTEGANFRTIALRKLIFPLLPQINAHNNSMTIEHDDGTFTVTLDSGYYTVQSFVNMLQAKLTAGWLGVGVGNSVTVNYDVDAREITITDNNAEAFFIQSTSSFILRGYNVVGFPSQAPGSARTTTAIASNNLTMIYSRFATIRSNRLAESQRGTSMLSSTGASNIIAVVDLASGYDSSQFATGSAFPGTARVFDTEYAPKINVLNRHKNLRVFDVEIIDEFGIGVERIYEGLTENFEYPIVMWFVAEL
jgi:hypothetical protein